MINTNLSRHTNPVVAFALAALRPLALKSVPQGAATEVFVATSPTLADGSGEYFSNSNVARPRADARRRGAGKEAPGGPGEDRRRAPEELTA